MVPENSTQFERTGSNPVRDIVIGLDFGSSFTKVVLQDPPSKKAFAVPFPREGHPRNKFLLPSKLVLDADGTCELGLSDNFALSHIKRDLMEEPKKYIDLPVGTETGLKVVVLASIYLALVLRSARRWFLANLRDEYGRSKIRWHLNVGIPAKNYDEKNIRVAFLAAARFGWWLSIQEKPLTIQEVTGALQEPKDRTFLSGPDYERVQVVPEVAAEVAGYARSPFRRLGLHMILDIGDSTMDIATFRLQTSPEQTLTYWFLWAEVSKCACADLHSRRVDLVTKELKSWLESVKQIVDLHGQVPESYDAYSPPSIDLSHVDAAFIKSAAQTVIRTAAISYRNRDPNADEWREGVPAFVCGGGCNLSLFRKQFMNNVHHGLRNYFIEKFRMQELPRPDNLTADGLDSSEYHRLAVAYGLSFFYDDIGRIVPPSEIDDIVRVVPVKEVPLIDKDMV